MNVIDDDTNKPTCGDRSWGRTLSTTGSGLREPLDCVTATSNLLGGILGLKHAILTPFTSF